VFRDMDQDKFRGLQNVLDAAQSLLWVTSGAQSGQNPDANIAVGLSSTIMAERMDLRLQFFDVDNPLSVNGSMLANMLVRLAILDPTKAEDLLWNQEPELALRNGVVYVPRVQALENINFRSVARRKQVTQPVSLGSKDKIVMIKEDQGAFELQAVPVCSTTGSELHLHVAASSFHTLCCVDYGAVYLCMGRELVSGDGILALAKENSSVVKITTGQILSRWQHVQTIAGDTAQLQLFLARAIAEHVLDGLEGPGSVWIHGVPQDLNDALQTVANEKKINLFQTTSDMEKSSDAEFIHPFASRADVLRLCPKDLQRFVNLAGLQQQAWTDLVCTSLSASAVVVKSIDEFLSGFDVNRLRGLAERHFHGGDQPVAVYSEAVTIDEVATITTKQLGPSAVVDWSITGTVNATIRPLEHNGLFSPNKTYLLCGMTGDLGISVCLWMVENGARSVVLTSRSPNVSPSVLKYLSDRGANVRPMAVDIANIGSLRSACADIKATMPPIGGLMNAAMVLRDRLFSHMSWEDFAAVLAPKVTGSKNLNEVFGDEALEFFVCFSSTTSIAGSIGQSAYAAANQYMSSLVRQRHQRGLAGSTVHLALLTGFGYISRIDTEHADTIYKALSPRLDRQSETDLHEILAEAIVCGRPGSDQPAELITGLKTVFQDEWRDDPRLSCYTGQQELEDSSNQGNSTSISVKAQLDAAEDPAECLAILEKRFANALSNLLEIDADTLDSSTSVASLGIDSLVAIRVREWFLKELGVDVPVLKVMSDTYSMSRMCDDVLVGWRKLKQS
jgi:NAD(P)-dependent dehydrogenase (short-subunit alcohol dehydrogenase family)